MRAEQAIPENASDIGGVRPPIRLAFQSSSPSTPHGIGAATGASEKGSIPSTAKSAGQRPRWLASMGIPAGLLAGCAALLVGADVVERHFFPDMSTGWHHALLTVRAAMVTAVGCSIVYLLMRVQQRRLSQTAEHLSSLLESYKYDPDATRRFDNPHLVHCRDVLACRRTECPMYHAPGQRCWQVVALGGACRGGDAQPIHIHQCHECAVYRQSCPDRLTELGESFNNLMFLLEAEASQVGRMRAQLVEKEKMVAIGQMASGIAHEVGNPLSSISSIVQMLKRAKGWQPANDQLDLIQTHIRRISATVRQLVSLARPTSDGWELLDLGRVLEEAVRLISFDRRARDVEIDYQQLGSLPATFGLKGQLEQVVINLALNALDAMPEGGKLTIRAEQRRPHIVVRIADTGIGIPDELGRRVFEPFFTTKEAGRGTGLGLSVSYGIVQKHGGSIDFTSPPGQGTEFTVKIPIVDEPPDV